jgi:hypothetical protein
MKDNNLVQIQPPASQAIDELSGGNGIDTGSSAPRAFKSEYFDYNFAKFLGLTTYSGAEPGECFTTAHSIEDGNIESWTKAWQATAIRVETLARRVLEQGHRVSAREAFLRATTYYQAAFFFIPDEDQ